MGATLVWRPVVPQEGRELPYKFLAVLERREQGLSVESYWGPDDLDYLQGLKDAGIDGAEDMIAAIKKHGHIKLNREY